MTAIVYQTDHAKKLKPAVQPQGSEAVTIRAEFDLSAVLLITDVIKMAYIPANCRVVDWQIDSDDLSSTAAGTFGLGILTAGTELTVDTTASGGAAWVAASTLMQAGGLVSPAIVAHKRMVVSRTADQLVGLVMAESCTVTTTGKIGLTLTYIAA